MKRGKPKNAEEALVNRVLDETTILKGFKSGPEQYFRVYDYYPRRDVPGEKIEISGGHFSLALQYSLLNGIVSYFSFDWSQWKEQFENGFSDWRGFHRDGLYADRTKPWGREREYRPLIVELQSRESKDYHLVEYFPDRSKRKRSFLISGTYQEISLQIRQMQLAEQVLGERSIGQFLAYPVAQWNQQAPILSPRVTALVYAGREWEGENLYPLQEKDGKTFRLWHSQIQIFQPDLRKLTYRKIRNTMGGDSGLAWGEWSARAYLTPKDRNSNPNNRDKAPDGRHKSNSQMVAWGDTEDSAVANLERFLELSKATLTAPIKPTRNRKDKGAPKPKSYRVYPGSILVEPPSSRALQKAIDSGQIDSHIPGEKSKHSVSMREPSENWLKDFKKAINSLYGS